MKKIRVLHHSNQLGLGGTEKVMQIFCKYLDKDVFDVYACAPRYPVPPYKIWINALKSRLGSRKARELSARYELNHSRYLQFTEILGEDHVFLYKGADLNRIIEKNSPHILHVHHSGETDPPLNQPEIVNSIPVIFTINMFGCQGDPAHQKKISRILFPSQWLKDYSESWSKGNERCGVLYCPIEKPYSNENLRGELGISEKCFVLGRIGRNADDIHDIISLKAYKEIENDQTLFLIISAPPKMKEDAQDLGIKYIRYLDPSVDDTFLSQFYNTIDVFAHARLDGETFGCVIAEAMIHGKPVVTHRSNIRNAQAELVDSTCGFIVEQNDWKNYAVSLKRLREDRNLQLQMGQSARKRAIDNFEAGHITKNLERLYLDELKKKGVAV